MAAPHSHRRTVLNRIPRLSRARFLVWLLVLVPGLACAGSGSSSGSAEVPSQVFPIDEAAMDRILREAMEAEFGAEDVHAVKNLRLTYEANLRFLLREDRIVASASPAIGMGPDGKTRAGYVITVENFGSAEMAGGSARNAVFKHAVEAAGKLAEPLPLLNP